MPIKFQKNVQNIFFENFTLSNENYGKKSGWVFNSTCLPSGNLVDGLPLDLLIIRMQEGFDSYWARALKYFFLPCDPAGKINSLYNEEVFHSNSKFVRMNDMCVDIRFGALQNERL